MGVVGVGGQQGLVREDVDPAQQTPGIIFYFAYRRAVEQGAGPVTAGAYAAVQIFTDIVRGKGIEAKTVGNPLLQLAYLRGRDHLIQLRLPEQHDLQQLVVLCFEIAQQAHLFQGPERHALGLFHEHHHLPALAMTLQQIILQAVHDLEAGGIGRKFQLQFKGDGVQDVFRRQAGIGDIDDLDLVRQFLLQHSAEHGLAAADLAHHLDDTFAVEDGIHQRLQHHPAFPARIEQAGVRGDPEGGLLQAEIIVIHVSPAS